MGTSSDYTGGVGGAWTPYKIAASNFARRGGRDRVDKVLARYVGALGGAAAAAASARAASIGAAGAIGDFGAGLAVDGLTPTLQRLGLGHLVGRDRWEVLDGLAEALVGDGSTDEDKASQFALTKAFQELFPEDAQTYEELEEVKLDGEDVVRLIESFVAWRVYSDIALMLDKKYADIEDQSLVEERDQVVRDRIKALVRLELMDKDPLAIDWRGPEGQGVIARVIDELYKDMETLE